MGRFRQHPRGVYDRRRAIVVPADDPDVVAWIQAGNAVDPMARFELRAVGVFDRVRGREIRPTDPEWADYAAALAAGDAPDPQPAETPPPDPRFDPIVAGRAREARKLARLAESDPAAAALVAVGIKRSTRK